MEAKLRPAELASLFLELEEEEPEPPESSVSEEESSSVAVPLELPFFEDEEDDDSSAALHTNLSPLMSPSLFNLLNSRQVKSPVESKLKPPATLCKDSKVPLSNLPLRLTEPPMVSNFGKPSKDFNSSFSWITKAPPIDFNLGKSISSKLSFF
ncbi:hypothetical protein PGUG_04459 [Meyerozyma guilliermondii ATCC 6260]|uniref:Uncharacterized protein n=1 Tax=Meyerozyma guilliermondii (strain ATCC 6260 / CBS 566 / DSM 6381 / JCM 1539 / NBRC 10279 / NRRL Y-324) TaxID=294746 RepID=A5DMF8_PICGU|nr:uncharacterized protein PGUG_04459 [Meyerozyma guilliermondii ATCC 6260]EDK40361.2 hypothetical protein PGUG_04459 [Meyerozyma guilliermondii ATCC 6260]